MLSIYSWDSGYIRADTWVCPYGEEKFLKFREDASEYIRLLIAWGRSGRNVAWIGEYLIKLFNA